MERRIIRGQPSDRLEARTCSTKTPMHPTHEMHQESSIIVSRRYPPKFWPPQRIRCLTKGSQKILNREEEPNPVPGYCRVWDEAILFFGGLEIRVLRLSHMRCTKPFLSSVGQRCISSACQAELPCSVRCSSEPAVLHIACVSCMLNMKGTEALGHLCLRATPLVTRVF